MTSRPHHHRTNHARPLRRLTAKRGRRAYELSRAAVMLGNEHPLLHTLDRLAVLQRQLLISSLALAAAGLAYAAAVSNAALWFAASALVGLALATTIAAQRTVLRDQARELIIEDRGDLPLRLLARERQRLTSRRTRASLARGIERITTTAASWPCVFPRTRPVFDVPIVRAATPELEALAQLLRVRSPQAQAAALTERLLTSGSSPLFGQEPDALLREVNAIRAQLQESPAELDE